MNSVQETQPAQPDIDGPTVTLAEAARRSHLSAATLRRWLAGGKILGATRHTEGRWVIPVAALVQAGALNPTTSPDPDSESLAEALAKALADRDRAISNLDTERRLKEAAERNADDLRTALRMLDAGPTTPSPPDPARPSWYRRVLGREARQREKQSLEHRGH